jgi:thymidylate synthase (FAD)
MQTTREDRWRRQSRQNRQGSGAFLDVETGAKLSNREHELQRLAREIYEERLEAGVAREQARKDLPLSTYTEAYWKINLHNLFHFLRLRMDVHAQEEIREYAVKIGQDIVAAWCPLAWEAFLDYRTQAVHLTKLEAQIVRLIGAGRYDEAVSELRQIGFLEQGDHGLRQNRERDELEIKLRELGFGVPWESQL